MKIKKQFHKGMGLFLICLLFLTTISINISLAGNLDQPKESPPIGPTYIPITPNDIEIYKYLNITRDEKDLTELSDGVHQKYAGAVFMMFKVSDKEAGYTIQETEFNNLHEELRKLSIKELQARYKEYWISEKTDANGRTVFRNVADGRYYIIEVKVDGDNITRVNTTEEILIDIPYYKKDGQVNPLRLYPKGIIPTITPPPDSPPTTGGEQIYKVDSAKKSIGLPGAQFQVFTKVDDEYKPLKIDGNDVISSSNTSGYVEFDGLPFGTYYVKEIVPPKNYIGMEGYFEIEISATSLDDINIKEITNVYAPPQSPPPGGSTTPGGGTTYTSTTPRGSSGAYTTSNPPASGRTFTGEIPRTGDIQIYLYAIAGIALISIGGVLYQSDKKARIQ